MGFTLGLAQTGFPSNGDVLALVDSLASRAQKQGVTLLAFPENLMHPRELCVSELQELAEHLDGPFVRHIQKAAQENGLWIAFTMAEKNPTGELPYNTAVVVDATSTIRGSYRKCHLYDAHSVRESDRMTAGSELCQPIRTPFGTIGLGICYDLRFPEVARGLALKGCDLILFPAAWHDGPNKKMHWKTLLRARAIENECFVAGICHGGDRYVRRSYAFDPLGNKLAYGGDELLVCNIVPVSVLTARDAMPVFDHRRPELYAR